MMTDTPPSARPPAPPRARDHTSYGPAGPFRAGSTHPPALPLPAGIEALLLDMDGTLVDSDRAVERAWRTWATEYGVNIDSVLVVMHGNPADHTVRRFLPHLDEAALATAAARQLALQYEDLSDVVAAPGARSLLSLLERMDLSWAVVTSADATLARARLSAAGITPPLVVTRDDVRIGKPDPEGYLLAADRLGVQPGRSLVVEDSVPGIEAGARAGARVAALRGLHADFTIGHLGELAALLAASDPRITEARGSAGGDRS